MVIVDDPLRSVHALPGVAANNDLKAEFALRGAGFDQVGVYVDGVRTAGFVHLLSDSGTTDQLSLSVVNQDTLASAALTPGVNDARTGGVTAGALALDTREGNRDRLTAHLSTGLVVSSGVARGAAPTQARLLAAGWPDHRPRLRAARRRSRRRHRRRGRGRDPTSDSGISSARRCSTRRRGTRSPPSWLAGAFTNDELDGSGAKSSNRLGSLAWRAVVNSRVFTRVQGFVVSADVYRT